MSKSGTTQQRKQLRRLLRQMRVEAGLRQVDLARLLDAPQSFISKYESGERRLDVIEFRQVCNALEVSIGDAVRQLEALLK
ncbi:MAG: helix-turn-helix transcriptional regulator [Terriglobales bacterium]|jgi:transcriptional regulator with XRE-family HTH domain